MRALHRLSVGAALLVAGASLARAADAPAVDVPPNAGDVLGTIVVVAGASRPLPRVAVVPSLASDIEDVTLHAVTRRDLDLCGEFELLPASEAPEEALLATAVDVRPWANKRVEALIQVSARRGEGQDRVEITGRVYLVARGPTPVFARRFLVPAGDLRAESHRLVDLLIGALTGKNGGFGSHLAFVAGTGKLRQVYTMDADGHGAAAVSPAEAIALAPAFGKNEELFWSSSVDHGEYQLRAASGRTIPLPVRGSVYGLAFSRDRSQVVVSIGVEGTIKLFAGPDFEHLTPASGVGMALRPTFTPSGKLAFAGEGRYGQRIYVDGKPITPEGLFASAPTFCNHPDGVRVVFAVGNGKDTDLVASGERGGDLVRLTQGQGRNGYPACSPDGRLLAFFSTRTSGEGPGLYLMRLDGGRSKRISTLVGDSLRWESLPPGRAIEVDAKVP
ncbi:tolB protein [Polyangium sorediatum]|uniref:TolB protein n=1 Tax=Polyangium sorediatum TaxID=889274 RepID=A0ABT6NME6_9BACT|nr:tolB protein [Polyangium sorediatum]MDI1429489.1 tolB protein [Polyangium sorediatum]